MISCEDEDEILGTVIFSKPTSSSTTAKKKTSPKSSVVTVLDNDIDEILKPKTTKKYTSSLSSKVTVTKRRKLTPEEKELKEIEKQKQKELKQQQKDEEKRKKEEEKERNRLRTVDECLEELIIKLDRRIMSNSDGDEIMSSLQELGSSIVVDSLKLPNSIEWQQKLPISFQSSQNDDLDEDSNLDGPVKHMNKVVIRLLGDHFVDMLSNQTFYSFVKKVRDAHPNKMIIYIIESLNDALRNQKKQNNRAMRKSSQEEITMVGKQDIDNVSVWMQIEAKAHLKMTSNVSETIQYLKSVTMIMANSLQQKNSLELGFCAESVNRIKTDNAWMAHLMQIPGVSFPVAKGIAKQYPSFSRLMSEYESRQHTLKEKELLLASLERADTTKRKIGASVSSKVFHLVTENDGNKLFQDL